jgi:hypothetical protein
MKELVGCGMRSTYGEAAVHLYTLEEGYYNTAQQHASLMPLPY